MRDDPPIAELEALTRRAEKALAEAGGDARHLASLAAELEEEPRLLGLARLVRERVLTEEAWDLLRERDGSAESLLEHADKLKQASLFGVARRVLERARRLERRDPGQLPAKTRLKLIQRHALCTYKDPEVPAFRALDEALGILMDDADLATTTDAETLGLAGGIFKRRWQLDGDKQHLESSLTYYLRGYHGVGERGYPGINAAYLLDLLAHVEDQQALETTGSPSPKASRRRADARQLRLDLVQELAPDDDNWWWSRATLAEAHFGLGAHDTEARRAGGEGHYAKALAWVRDGVLPAVADQAPTPWELESTARQLAALAQLQVGGRLSEPAWEVIRQLVGPEDATALVGAEFKGKLGLGLSGGGFRASLFHIGLFARLAELDLLRHVEVLSCVSGGSIVGAYYYLAVRQLLEKNEDGKIEREDYIRIVAEMADGFLAGVQCNLRTRVAGSLWSNIKMAVLPRYTRTERLAELFEKRLYSVIGRDQELTMDQLGIRPKGQNWFLPSRGNWRRRNKVPNLVLNATSLNTGHNWQFTTSSMGESAFAVDDEIDGNWLLRRLPYRDAPAEHRKIPLGKAVGASACVPGLFAPVVLHGLYPKNPDRHPQIVVRLIDGGVHDNQGVVSLLEQDCSVIIASDASGQMTSDPEPSGGLLGPILRTNSVLMERVRQAQFQDLKARRRSGLLKQLMIVHMKKAFDVEAIDWRTCEEPPPESDAAATEVLPYEVRKDLQALLADSRTDLDAFSDVEAWALMTSGYLMSKRYAADLERFFDPEDNATHDPHDWDFLTLVEPLGSAKGGESPDAAPLYGWVRRNLESAGLKVFRIFKLSPALAAGAQVAAALAAAALVWRFWDSLPLLSILGVGLGLFLVGKGRELLLGLGRLVLAFVAFLGAQVLLFLDFLAVVRGRVPDPGPPSKGSTDRSSGATSEE